MVAVCNNLAFGKIDKESDIDLFIVAKENRLFLVRSIVTFLFHILGVRRHSDKVAGRFCLSFFVDEKEMDLSIIANENDYYLAYWVANLKPVVVEPGFPEDFIVRNNWIKEFYPQDKKIKFGYDRVVKVGWFSYRFKFFLRFIFSGRFGDFMEILLMKWQIKRAKLKMKAIESGHGLKITKHILKFHNIDRRNQYNLAWIGKKEKDDRLLSKEFLTIINE